MDFAELNQMCEGFENADELVKLHAKDLKKLNDTYWNAQYTMAMAEALLFVLAEKYEMNVSYDDELRAMEMTRNKVDALKDMRSEIPFKYGAVILDHKQDDRVCVEPTTYHVMPKDESLRRCDYKPSKGKKLNLKPREKKNWIGAAANYTVNLGVLGDEQVNWNPPQFVVHADEPIRNMNVRWAEEPFNAEQLIRQRRDLDWPRRNR
jgi:hypothetical protein